MSNHWSVTVSLNGDRILTIEPELVSGKDIEDAEEWAIRSAIMNLCGFIGCRLHDDEFDKLYELSQQRTDK